MPARSATNAAGLRDEQREFQREAYEIAAEARWQERQDRDEYGSY